ncbi:MAG: 16S rRNA (adenine(1518)-N(6)/adenine(1519)-N(6))-dimethyltransferase RsmA [Lachnospiraceae bacterium]|nr:16S rRNA (adenine(1518)-N(6)/adenine(1519)-N(6))-dimethyltransferase RsmA [Lachnospiraceae bacterium]
MGNLINAGNTIEIIKKYNFTFQKRYGQNFLIDNHVLEKICNAADISGEDHVIEIGPGIGTMTQNLCERAKKVTAIEIDKELIPILKETLAEYDNVEIINEDVLKLDLKKLIKDKAQGMKTKVVANLPYYITTPIVMYLLEERISLSNITIMIQKEVADRMQATPGGKEYGALSLAVNYYSSPKVVSNVPPNCFIPRPKVASSVICLSVYDEPKVKVNDERMMFKLIRASFNQRRKTLVNSLINASDINYKKDDIIRALKEMELNETIRGEALSVEQFAVLTNILLDRTDFDKS